MATEALTIQPDQQQRLEAMAVRQTCSPELLVREAIDDYLAAHEEDVVYLSPEELKELDDANEHYERTGLHITGDEFSAWVARIKAGERVPIPECHP